MLRFNALVASTALATALLAAPSMGRAENVVGHNVDELVTIARSMSPELQMSAAEADAATARVEGAGSFADPKIQLAIEDWSRNRPGYWPTNPAASTTKKLRVFQEIPFWGKRDLKRDIAQANAKKANVLKKAVENDLVARIKAAYAEYHQAHQSIDVAKNLRGRLDTLAKLARARYAQGLGKQQDVTRAEVEKSSLDGEIARMEADRQRARVRINRLLARDLSAPLVEEPHARPVPATEALDIGVLTERAQQQNPELLAQEALIKGADSSVELAEKSWYPDVELGIGAVKREGDWQGYEAMVTMNVPIQWGLRDADIGEAKAMASAARLKRKARQLEIGNDVQDAWYGLVSARKVETFLREGSLPQAEIGFQAAAKAYELGRSDIVDVLMTEQQLWKAQIDLLKTQLEQQLRVAELEKLVGGEL